MQTQTPVSRISKSPNSASAHRWQVDTPRGSVSARVVVLATNAYTSALAPQYKDTIIPVRGTCSRIVVPPDSDVPRLTNTYILRWDGSDYDYLIPRGDGSIVVGGARSAFIHDLKNWYDVSDDSRVLESAVRYFDGYMQRNFVGWENSHAYTDRVWTGSMYPSPPVEDIRLTGFQSWDTLQMNCHMLVKFLGRMVNIYLLGSRDTACRRYSLLQKALQR